MSNQYITWALNQKTGSASAKAVLFKLADQANDDGECYPSIETISRHTELSKATVKRQIKFLEESGFISVSRRRSGSTNLPNVYHLHMGGVMVNPLGSLTNVGGVMVNPGWGHGDTQTLIKPSIEPSKINKASSDAPIPSEIEKAFSNYNIAAETLGLPKATKITADRKRRLAARLRDYGLAGWNEALERLEDSEFLCGKNDRGFRADLEFLLQPKSFARLIEGGYDGD